ncbi:MAG: ATP-binding protein [Lachnospiraceae bacterium]|nr:ATP-binding protein [Lachnospiraceae bacterium]
MALPDSKYDEIMREYDKKRMKNTIIARKFKERLFSKIPGLKALEQEIIHVSSDSARRYIEGNDEALKGLDLKISDLADRRAKLLREHGLSPNALEIQYDCPNCMDTGFTPFGRCHCLQKKLIDALYDESGIMEVLSRENFSTYDPEVYSENVRDEMKRAYNGAIAFVDEFDTVYRNLLFIGNIGSGKTFLTNCIAKALLDKGFNVLYFTSYNLFKMISNHTFNRGMDNTEEINSYKDIFGADLLIIDDLGTESSNSFTMSQFFIIINERNERHKPTLISTNLSLESLLDTYSERAMSRLLGGYDVYAFYSADIRLKNTVRD